MSAAEVLYRAPSINAEDYKRYRGRHVALYKGKIIADGGNSVEAMEKALKIEPKLKPEQVELYYVQMVDELIL
jgi:uncharacterized Fe-S cluster protein YjdI